MPKHLIIICTFVVTRRELQESVRFMEPAIHMLLINTLSLGLTPMANQTFVDVFLKKVCLIEHSTISRLCSYDTMNEG